MAKTWKAPFPQNTKLLRGRVTGATAAPYTTTTNMVQAQTGSGSALSNYSVGTEGALLSAPQATPRNTSGATALYLFVSQDGGTTRELIATGTAAAYSQSTSSAPTPTALVFCNGLTEYLVPPSATLYFAAGVALADGWDFQCQAKEYA